jgi:hypothetical protein
MISNKPGLKVSKKFYSAIERPAPAIPLNSALLSKKSRVIVEKATSLLAYQNYLAQARRHKASRQSVSLEFEREIQAQARVALSEMQTLGGSGLRLIKHIKNAGMIGHILERWQDAVNVAGPVQAETIWDDMLADAETRRAFTSLGISDEILTRVADLFAQLKPSVVLDQGQLSLEVKVPGQTQVAQMRLINPNSRRPRTVSELLRQGQFDRLVELYDQPGGIKVDIATSRNIRPPDVSEAALVGAVLGMQELARHVRKLEDTGLAIYEGKDPATILIAAIIGGMLLVALGLYITGEFCDQDNPDSTACSIGWILFALGLLMLTGGGLIACLGLTGPAAPVCAYYNIVLVFALLKAYVEVSDN